MTQIIEKGTALFPPELIPGMVNLVKGESSIASLAQTEPIAFTGRKEFTFTMDSEVDIVAESGAKTNGGVTITPVTVVPIKFEYGTRITDEFLSADEDFQLGILQSFVEGFGRKLARGLDIAAFHGLNPRTGAASAVVGSNSFDTGVTQKVIATANPDADMDTAIMLIESQEGNVSGAAFSPGFRSALATKTDSTGRRLYPELAWGQTVGSINGLPVTANPTVSFGESLDLAILGDFESAFRWGYAKEMTLEVIPYGNPDNDKTLGDLKGHNQVYLRSEAYIGWGILVPEWFARIQTEEEK
ncbi:MAG: phage major capsid protein [Clostridiales bacterium]|nr:phage major capsid protein [Clostridiales bacterium]